MNNSHLFRLDDLSLGEKLIARLRTCCPDLPDSGIVAGQALCSLMLQDRGFEAPINDIDIFRFHPYQYEDSTPKPRLWYASPVEGGHRALHTVDLQDGYAGVNNSLSDILPGMAQFTIRGSIKNGLLNFIEMEYQADVPMVNRDLQRLLVSDFDLNLVQISVDLETAECYYTQEFVQFLRSFQVEVTSVMTPPSTAARLLRKLDEMPYLHANIDWNLKVLAVAGQRYRSVSMCLGESRIGAFERYAERLGKFFRVSPYTAIRWCPDGEEVQPAKPRYTHYPVWLFEACPTPNMVTSILPESVLRDLDQNRYLIDFPYTFLLLCKLHADSCSKAQKKKLSLFLRFSQGTLLMALIADPRTMLSGNVSRSGIAEMNRFLGRHPQAVQGLLGISLEQQILIKRHVHRRYKQGQRHLVGMLENAFLLDGQFAGREIVRRGPQEYFANFNARLNRQSSAHLIPSEQLSLPLIRVRQLTGLDELLQEGKTMKHCVGGYFGAVATGRSIILSFRSLFRPTDPKRASTLEIISDNGQYRIAQHYGLRNSTPSFWHCAMARVLVNRLSGEKAGWWDAIFYGWRVGARNHRRILSIPRWKASLARLRLGFHTTHTLNTTAATPMAHEYDPVVNVVTSDAEAEIPF